MACVVMARSLQLASARFGRSSVFTGVRFRRIATCINLGEGGSQHIELLLPVLRVAIEPDGGVHQGLGGQAAAADTPGALLLNEPGSDQHLNVARYAL